MIQIVSSSVRPFYHFHHLPHIKMPISDSRFRDFHSTGARWRLRIWIFNKLPGESGLSCLQDTLRNNVQSLGQFWNSGSIIYLCKYNYKGKKEKNKDLLSLFSFSPANVKSTCSGTWRNTNANCNVCSLDVIVGWPTTPSAWDRLPRT